MVIACLVGVPGNGLNVFAGCRASLVTWLVSAVMDIEVFLLR